MAPEQSRMVRQTTFVLLVLAAAATEVGVAETRPLLASFVLAGLWVSIAALLAFLVRLPAGRAAPSRLVFLVLVLLAAAPFLVEPLRRRWTGEGFPLELQMVLGLRNLGLGLAAFSAWRLCLRLACVVSLFLMLFALSLTDHPAVLTLLGLYSAAGSVWLMLGYWSGLGHSFAASETASLEVQPGRETLPWLAVFVFVAVVGGVLGLLAVGPKRAAGVLWEWLPTSGGTGGYDPFARGGVNDGDDEVKGENARSTGMTQSETFLDSPLPSLYDMFNDQYGEPFKPESVERAIALDPQTKVNENKKPPADNLRPNREFPTTRKSPRQPRDPSDRAARALFEIQGRTPLHVRVAAFDCFDGLQWQEAPLKNHHCLLEKEQNSCWMMVHQRQLPLFAETEQHQFKITRSTGTLVPTPTHLLRFRVGRVNQTDFFRWSQDRILCLSQRKTPSGIMVETECNIPDPRLLGSIVFPGRCPGDLLQYADLPSTLNPEIAALAHCWAGGDLRGWPQIAAVVRHLREEYILDPSYRVPEDCRDPLGHFLLHSRRGPDYQFATAAAVLLRVLGYSTRLVSGFYAAPDHYDPETRHTPVVQEDLHFWAEVRLPSGDWLVLEPTPGYEVLGPGLSWSERLLSILLAAVLWTWQHLIELGLGAVLLGGLWWWRREMIDGAAVLCWRWFPGRTWRQCVRRALSLLERRGRWAGRARRCSQTVSAWLRCVLPKDTAAETEMTRLTALAEWAAYALAEEPPWPDKEVLRVCRQVLAAWTLRRWRSVPPLVANGA